MNAYAELARKLAVPTEGQTLEFAEFVTGAHSWYKHLAVHPPSPFVFFLDPNAGRAMVHVSDDEVAFVDNTDESKKFHYTWQTTEAYRRRFGFWNYEADYGSSFQFPSDEGVVDTAGSGLQILSHEGGWLQIPKRLAHAGTALLSALMYDPTWRPKSSPMSLLEQEVRIVSILHFRLPFGRVSHAKDRERLERGMPMLPDDMAEALRPLLALWTGEAYPHELAETHYALDELYRKAAASDLPFKPALDAGGHDVLYRQAQEAWEMTASRRQERVLLEPLVAALDRERQRQIDAMVQAMNQFVEMLHAAGDVEGRLH